jgi:hypothetical protein
MLAKPPFAGADWIWIVEGDGFVRAGTGDRWIYNQDRDLWRWSCTDDQWKVVLAVIPKALLARANLDAARMDYNESASDYLCLTFYHQARFAKGSPAKLWRRGRKHIEAALTGIEADSSLSYQADLRAALRFAESATVAFEMEGTTHHGSRPERDGLYHRLLSMWTRLGSDLRTGRPGPEEKGKRTADGPTIRFLLAALMPILRDDMIGAEAAEKIIEAEIERRKRLPEMTASWVKVLNAMKNR